MPMKYAIKFDVVDKMWYPVVVYNFFFFKTNIYFNKATEYTSWAEILTCQKYITDSALGHLDDHAYSFESKEECLNFIKRKIEIESKEKSRKREEKILSKQNRTIIIN